MPKMIRRVLFAVIVFFLFPAVRVWGQDYIPLVAPSAILVEKSTGKTLYAKNEYARMYPASMTKILTAIVALEYLSPDDIIVVGTEIYGLPPDYNTQVHSEGESITVKNLLRALIIRSGNETGCILAINAIRAKENRDNITYAEAERAFCALMNEKARELGALDSNFTNPYGLHDTNHYTTAYDLALICRAYMDNEVLRDVAAMREYSGDSLDGRELAGAITKQYTWDSHNELLLSGANSYPYATGIKTGFTDAAGDCLSASAAKNNIELIAVIFFSADPGRWQDARLLFDYGFETFSFQTVQEKDIELETMPVADPRLGDSGVLTVLTNDFFDGFFSNAEIDRLQRTVTYDAKYLTVDEEGATALKAPIEKDEILGAIQYALDGTIIFEGTFRAADSVAARNFDSDMDYYIEQFQSNIFTVKALPYWEGGIGLLVGLIGIMMAIASRRARRRDRWHNPPQRGRYRGY